MYKPGLHLLIELIECNEHKLSNLADWDVFMQTVVLKFELVELGKVMHVFNTNGFTALHCLSESHIAVHTWPESRIATFDIYLCNYSKDNTNTVLEIGEEIHLFFGGLIHQKNTIVR